MINKNVKQGPAPKITEQPTIKEKNATTGQVAENLESRGIEKPNIKKRKRHNSALVAAAQAESAVSAANARSSGDVGFGTTGTNLTYKEDGGTL